MGERACENKNMKILLLAERFNFIYLSVEVYVYPAFSSAVIL